MREAGFHHPLCGIVDNNGKLPIKLCCIVGMREGSISDACKNCHEMQTENCTMLALDQRVVDFSMIEYTFEVIVTQ